MLTEKKYHFLLVVSKKSVTFCCVFKNKQTMNRFSIYIITFITFTLAE